MKIEISEVSAHTFIDYPASSCGELLGAHKSQPPSTSSSSDHGMLGTLDPILTFREKEGAGWGEEDSEYALIGHRSPPIRTPEYVGLCIITLCSLNPCRAATTRVRLMDNIA